MKEVLGELAAQGIIEIRDKSGAKKKHPNIKSGSDILKVPKQKLFFF
jgi:DNA-binding FadR family transcriptional regulator